VGKLVYLVIVYYGVAKLFFPFNIGVGVGVPKIMQGPFKFRQVLNNFGDDNIL